MVNKHFGRILNVHTAGPLACAVFSVQTARGANPSIDPILDRAMPDFVRRNRRRWSRYNQDKTQLRYISMTEKDVKAGFALSFFRPHFSTSAPQIGTTLVNVIRS